MDSEQSQRDRFDGATARRLAKLGGRAVDTSALEARLDAALMSEPGPRAQGRRRWLSPLVGLAASLLVVAGVFFVVSSTGNEVKATVLELSQLHTDILAGRVALTPVGSVEEANAWIARQNAGGPELPRHLADARVQSCCLADVRGELVAVALLEVDDAMLTLVIAEAPGFAHEMGTVFEIDGRRYFGHELRGVRMMMANRGDRWLCVMGDADYAKLAELASRVAF